MNCNLIILCAGSNSNLIKKLFSNETINNSYKELAITTTISHSSINNNIARQIFLEKEILALLPISNNKTSIVWSVKNECNAKRVGRRKDSSIKYSQLIFLYRHFSLIFLIFDSYLF